MSKATKAKKAKVDHYDQAAMKAAYLKNHDLGDLVKALGCSRVYAHRRATLDGYYVRHLPKKSGRGEWI
jgi:hypothetical protein